MPEAKLTYVVETDEKPVSETHGPGGRLRHRFGTFETKKTFIADGRPVASALDIDREGFVFTPHDTSVVDFENEDEVKAIYHREVESLVCALTGASRAVVFDHTQRSASPEEQERKLRREPVHIAHNDYTEWSGPQRVRDIMKEEAPRLLAGRFAIVQVWRPTHLPIVQDPLALCDARSVRGEDLIAAERRHPDRVGEIYQLAYDSAQRWLYFPEMRRDEAVIFKVYDSEPAGVARFTPHVSFALPPSPGDPPRRSIEARALAFY